MKKINLMMLAMFLLTACASMTTTERDAKRSELDLMVKTTIERLVEQDAGLQKKIDDASGYMVADLKVTKVPIVGGGGGEGVHVNKETGKRTYFTVSRFDLGGGVGARAYKGLILFETQEAMLSLQNGTWEFQAGAEASAGTTSAEGSSGEGDKGYSIHTLSEGGASATATARAIRVKVNNELTDDN